HQVIAFHSSTDPACAGPDAVDFFALKQQYFSQTHPVELYAIFGRLGGTSIPHALSCVSSPDSSPSFCQTGQAEIAATNFVFSLGLLRSQGITGDELCFMEASTWMHELGHNLGLRHGGDEDTNDTPNYLSVMNYQYQYQYQFSGIVPAD